MKMIILMVLIMMIYRKNLEKRGVSWRLIPKGRFNGETTGEEYRKKLRDSHEPSVHDNTRHGQTNPGGGGSF